MEKSLLPNNVIFYKAILFGFYLVAFFSSISISISQIGLGIVLLFWLILGVCEKRVLFTSNSLSKPILFYTFAVLISCIFGINFKNSIYSIRDLWTCLIFFSLFTFVDDMKIVKKLLIAMFLGSVISAVYGILQHLLGGFDLFRSEENRIIQYAYLQTPNEVIATSFFTHHLTFGEVMLFSLCTSVALLFWTWKPLNKNGFLLSIAQSSNTLYVALSLLLCFALLFSYARGSWVGFALSFFFLLIFMKRKNSIIIGSLFIVLGTSMFFFHPPTRGRILSIFSQTERLYIWKIALDITVDHPITGVGLDNWREAALPKIAQMEKDNIVKFPDGGVTQHAHNNVLTRSAEEGLLGAMAFIYMFFVLYKDGIKGYFTIPVEERWRRGAAVGGLTGITAFHGAGLFENTFGDSEVAMLLWFMTGIVFICCYKIKQEKI